MSPHQQMILGIIAAVFASSGFWMLIQNQLHVRATKKSDLTSVKESLIEIKQRNSENDAMTELTKNMVMGLGFDKIKHLCTKYIDRYEKDGTGLTAEEYKELRKYLYEPYKAMGGNGTAEKLMKQVEQIPIDEKAD